MINVKAKIVECNVEVQKDYVIVSIVVESVLNIGLGVLSPVRTKSILKYPQRLMSAMLTRATSEMSVRNAEIASN